MHLKVVRILDSMEMSACWSSPSTRPQKNEYTSTEREKIMLQDSQRECVHYDNIEEGLKYHGNTVKEALFIFS